VSDIFNEVDEEVRREQLKKLWDRYSVYIVGAAVLLVVAVAGWRGYEWLQAKNAAEAGAAFQSAAALSDQGKHAEAEAAFAKLAETSTAGYRDLARLRIAAELAQHDTKAAVAAYDAVAADSGASQVMRDLAALRAGYLLVDSGSFADVRQRLEPIAGDGRTFRNSARELLGLAALKAGDTTAARNWFEAIASDPDASPDQRSRIDMMMVLVPATAKS
jgi:hypothetical protein